jgi:hypothetical protein
VVTEQNLKLFFFLFLGFELMVLQHEAGTPSLVPCLQSQNLKLALQ